MKHIKPKPQPTTYLTPFQLANKEWFPYNSKETVRKLIKQGKLPAISLEGGRKVISVHDARNFSRRKSYKLKK